MELRDLHDFPLFPYYDQINGMSVDCMHCVLPGVCRMTLGLWLQSKHHNQLWYIGTQAPVLDDLLCEIQPPNEIQRTPRSLQTKVLEGSVYQLICMCSTQCILILSVHPSHSTSCKLGSYIIPLWSCMGSYQTDTIIIMFLLRVSTSYWKMLCLRKTYNKAHNSWNISVSYLPPCMVCTCICWHTSLSDMYLQCIAQMLSTYILMHHCVSIPYFRWPLHESEHPLSAAFASSCKKPWTTLGTLVLSVWLLLAISKSFFMALKEWKNRYVYYECYVSIFCNLHAWLCRL